MRAIISWLDCTVYLRHRDTEALRRIIKRRRFLCELLTSVMFLPTAVGAAMFYSRLRGMSAALLDDRLSKLFLISAATVAVCSLFCLVRAYTPRVLLLIIGFLLIPAAFAGGFVRVYPLFWLLSGTCVVSAIINIFALYSLKNLPYNF